MTEWLTIKSNWIIRLVTKLVVVFTLLSVGLIALSWSKLPPLVPLWYSLPWGSDQLAHPIWLFLLPVGGLVLFFINLLFCIFLVGEYLIFSQILFLSSLLVSGLSLFTLIQILLLVT